MLVETVVEAHFVGRIAVEGRSGVEEVYGVPYLDVGCDVWFHVCWVHHFSPLITAIRRRPYQPRLRLSIPLPQDVEQLGYPLRGATSAFCGLTATGY